MKRRAFLESSGAALLATTVGAASPAYSRAKEISLDSNLATVGNSLIDQSVDMVHYFMSDYGRGRGRLSHQTIPGAPMNWNWNHAGSANLNGRALLQRGRQDIWMGVESVPFRHVQKPGDPCDITAWLRWHKLATGNGVKRFFIFEAWHDLNSGRANYRPEDPADPDTKIPWRKRIDTARRYWTGIADYVNARKRSGAPQMLMVPGGTMFARIYDDIKSGGAPSSLRSINDLFIDSIHPNTSGRYAMACVMYTCLFRRSPVGLPVRTADIHGRAFPKINPREAAYFQNLAWDVAVNEPYADL